MSSASGGVWDPAKNVAASISVAKVSFLWEWQGIALPCAAGDCTCKCLKLECDNLPVNQCRVCRKLLDPASRIHSWLGPHSSAFSHHKLLGIWD